MFNVVLVHPEIPPNTGNVIRLCANTGATLHLVRPLGFSLEDKHMKRAGLDYREYATIRIHDSWDSLIETEQPDASRMFAMTSHGSSVFSRIDFLPGDWFIFGAESSGLPPAILERFPSGQRIRLPMRPDNRSLNLSNAVAVTVFEAWRQNGYAGAV